MEHVWSVICLNYIIDRESGNLTLIDIPDRVGFKGDLPDTRPIELPLQSPFFLVSLWRSGHENSGIKESALVKVRAPNDNVIGEFEVNVEFGDSEGHQTYGKIETLLYHEDGVHRFEIYMKEDGNWSDEPVAFVPLELVHERPDSEQENSEPKT